VRDLVSGNPAPCERGEHVRTGERAEALPDVGPFHFAAEQPRQISLFAAAQVVVVTEQGSEAAVC